MLGRLQQSLMFRGIDVTLHENGDDIEKLIQEKHNQMEKSVIHYVAANNSPIEVLFSKDRCTIKFWFRSWRYRTVMFYIR